MIRRLAQLILILSLFGCTTEQTCAPVVNAWHDPCAMNSRYRVQRDDSLYSIAWSFDLDYRDLARANHLTAPYHLKPGQTLTMCVTPEVQSAPTATFAVHASPLYEEVPCQPAGDCIEMPEPCPRCPVVVNEDICLPQVQLNPNRQAPCGPLCESNLPSPMCTPRMDPMPVVKSGCWCWPACGKVVKEFALQTGGNKGIDIAGQPGDPIRAVAAGKIVYSGNGLRGYGNLIIIKHSDNYLSAYAYNRKLLVKEGDVVKAGSEIAKMGQNDLGQVLLHFEIRRNGKPVNPLLYL